MQTILSDTENKCLAEKELKLKRSKYSEKK
jgi:hypothetical protein